MAQITSKQGFQMGISIGKNLLAIEHWKDQETKKQENRVYLKNGQEFQIFLKNYRGIPVMVELTINGETQNESIILGPQERLFLERYLSSNNKFKFNTYELSAGLKKLIESKVELGVITARVYKANSVYETKTITEHLEQMKTNMNNVQPTWEPTFIGKGTEDYNGSYDTVITCANTAKSDNFAYFSDIADDKPYNMAKNEQISAKEQANEIHQEANAKAEIGAIERGQYSDQRFDSCPDYVKGSLLDSYTICVYPVSAQIREERKTGKIEGAVYCSVCGRKQKYGQKFCPTDGTEFGK